MFPDITVGALSALVLGVALAAVGTERNLTRNERQALTPGLCMLPKPLLHGQYRPSANRCRPEDDSPGCRMVPGAYVPNDWVMFFKCDEGYVPNSTQPVTFCKNGWWKPALPVCKSELCAELSSFGVDIECTYGRETVPCSEPMRPGTVATLDCQDGYHPAFNPRSKQLQCLDFGAWDYPLFYCIPGEAVTTPKPLLVPAVESTSEDHKTVKSEAVTTPKPLLVPAVESTSEDHKTVKSHLPGFDTCGLRYKQGFALMYNNERPTEPGEYPWIANIGYTESPPGGTLQWLCEGSLINDRYVITLAHCLHTSIVNATETNLYVTKVRLGELDLNPDVDDKATPTDFDIEKITYHEDFSNSRKENDIGLIKLKDKVTYTDLIRPICLPTPEFKENLFVGYHPIIAGWGRHRYGSRYNQTQQRAVEVEIMDTDSCRTNITSVSNLQHATLDHRVICAVSLHRFSCEVTSGGPMMLPRKINKTVSDPFNNFVLIGMSSYSPPCFAAGTPSMLTRVSEYMDWILNNVE